MSKHEYRDKLDKWRNNSIVEESLFLHPCLISFCSALLSLPTSTLIHLAFEGKSTRVEMRISFAIPILLSDVSSNVYLYTSPFEYSVLSALMCMPHCFLEMS